ncbi:MAG TPA: hypothetical protein VFT85_00545 [Acidimicrobiia bacterium]|nr:hypothetical protein [Acidimicrobiia bacterium]
MATGSTSRSRRPLAPRDIRFNRGVGLIVLLLGAVFVYSLTFSAFDQKVQFQWDVEADGGRTPRTHITCPSPWSVLVHGAEPQLTTTPGFCVMPSRSLALEAVIVSVITVALSVWLFTRTTRPAALPPLPDSVRDLNRFG